MLRITDRRCPDGVTLVLEGRLPALAHVGALAAMAGATFVLGHWFFRRSKHAFVDVL